MKVVPAASTPKRRTSLSLSVLTNRLPSKSPHCAAGRERCAGGGQRGAARRPHRLPVRARRPAAGQRQVRRAEAGVARPAVVAAGDDEVDLVVHVGTVLGGVDLVGAGPDGDPLRVAVPHRVHGVADAGDDRIVGGDRAVAIDAQHLPVQARPVLRVRRVGRVADRDPQAAESVHLDRAAVVGGVGGRAGEKHGGRRPGRQARAERVAQDLVLPAATPGVIPRGTDVDLPVGGEVDVDRDPHQAGLAFGADRWDGDRLDERRSRGGRAVDPDPSGALGHEHPPVRQEGHVPWDRERRGDHRGGEGRRRGSHTTGGSGERPQRDRDREGGGERASESHGITSRAGSGPAESREATPAPHDPLVRRRP